MRKKLPIGIQTFAEIRQEGHYYVDKTPQILRLLDEGKYYFLSRPRRFGKSLLIDTIAELFEGNQALFEGLYAEPRWDWSQQFAVIRISFGKGVLVDEYDKPILDNITEPDIAREMRDGLRNLYSVIKDEDAHIRFALLTGVSKFSKVSLFSGLNNLRDITVSTEYSALCGYTDQDVDTVFAPELPGLDRDEIRRWYNGYNWTGTSVYNPFDLLLLFQEREFRPYWFETGTPTFLVEVLTQRGTFTPELGQWLTMDSLLSTFDVDEMSSEALLFQSGYLTIGSQFKMGARTEYTLKYPNLEVESSLNSALLQRLTGRSSEPARQAGST